MTGHTTANAYADFQQFAMEVYIECTMPVGVTGIPVIFNFMCILFQNSLSLSNTKTFNLDQYSKYILYTH